MDRISFDVRLRHEDYDDQFKGWHCSVFRIPGVKFVEIYDNGGAVKSNDYKVDESAHSIQYKPNDARPTHDVTVRLCLQRRLSTTVAAAWIGVLAALTGAIAGAGAQRFFSVDKHDTHDTPPVTTCQPTVPPPPTIPPTVAPHQPDPSPLPTATATATADPSASASPTAPPKPPVTTTKPGPTPRPQSAASTSTPASEPPAKNPAPINTGDAVRSGH